VVLVLAVVAAVLLKLDLPRTVRPRQPPYQQVLQCGMWSLGGLSEPLRAAVTPTTTVLLATMARFCQRRFTLQP
jgi:hypothetical protein